MRTFRGVGTTGVVFGVIVAAWLAYLVPLVLRKHQAQSAQADPSTRFSKAVRIVQHGGSIDDEGRATRVAISTPMTRRAAIEEVRRSEQRAAGRRRNVMVALGLALATLVGLSAAGITLWWSVAIPGGLLVAFMIIARVSVQVMHRSFDRRLEQIEEACSDDTVIIVDSSQPAEKGRSKPGKSGVESVELGAPIGRPGTLWDPLPITRPTYVSAPPPGGRTVRTIDLSAPPAPVKDNKPVVADAPEPSLEVAPLKAVGE